jgi:hypothetical protein
MIDRRSTLKNAVLLIALAGREEIIAVTHCRTPPSAISRFLRSFDNASIKVRASRTVRSVPPFLVGSGRVSFFERYAGRNNIVEQIALGHLSPPVAGLAHVP